MKKLLALSLVLLFAFNSQAQRYGIRLGGNFSGMMSTVESEGTKIAPGMNMGILAEFGPKMVNLHAEINYAQKGFNQTVDTDLSSLGLGTMTTDAKINFDYLEVPLLIKVNPPFPMYFYAGPYFGFALNGEVASDFSVSEGELTDDTKETLDLKDATDLYDDDSIYKKQDYGVAAGLGSQFGLGPIHAFVEGRATLGLTNLYDTESEAYEDLVTEGAYKDTDHLKNMAYTIAVGIIFGK